MPVSARPSSLVAPAAELQSALPAPESMSHAALSGLLESQQLWQAQQLARNPAAGVPTGFAELDALLPGQGWPVGQLIELVHDMDCAVGSGMHSLLQPVLRQRCAQGHVVLVNPAFEPYMPAWLDRPEAWARVLRITVDAAGAKQQARACWAVEQALHCADVRLVIAWLPFARPEALRRLQLAASQSRALLFVVRTQAQTQVQASAAALRLAVQRMDAQHSKVQVLKCRGLVQDIEIKLAVLSPALRAVLNSPGRHSYNKAAVPRAKQPSSADRLTPRSRLGFLLAGAELLGNERAADVPASHEQHHGLDRPSSTAAPPSFITNSGYSTHYSPSSNSSHNSSPRELPSRQQRRASRQARSH